MKRLFWLITATGLSMGQAHAVANTFFVEPGYNDGADSLTLNDDEIDKAINSLTRSQNKYNKSQSRLNALQMPRHFNAHDLSPIYSEHANVQGTNNQSLAARIASTAAGNRSRSLGRCALYVRKALQAAGYSFTPQPSAYMYANGTLARAGFTKIANGTAPQVGDVVVFERSNKNPHGHIQIFDGKDWVSDFRQPKFSPYSDARGYTTWRDTRGGGNDAINKPKGSIYLAYTNGY